MTEGTDLQVGQHKKVSSGKMQCDNCHADTDILYDTPLGNGSVKRFCESCWLEFYKSGKK